MSRSVKEPKRSTCSNTAVDDLTPLSGLANLSYLDIRGTAVKDVTGLVGIPNLSELKVRGTGLAKQDLSVLVGDKTEWNWVTGQDLGLLPIRRKRIGSYLWISRSIDLYAILGLSLTARSPPRTTPI